MAKLKKIDFKVTTTELAKADSIVMSLCDLPRSQIRALFQHSCISINNQICLKPHARLNIGDQLTISYDTERKYKEKKKAPPSDIFKIIYEDGHLIVVDKEAGVLSVPTKSGIGNGETLLDHIAYYLPKGVIPEVVHRLDRDTSGLLVFAKSKGICKKLKDQFERRKPERVYFAFVKGKVVKQKGTFRSYLASDEDLNQYSIDNPEKGKLAITHYVVEKNLDDATWVKVNLETGRRNQIRVHFSEHKHPILGDKRYEPRLAKHPKWEDSFLALHATTLGFIHPVSNKKLYFESELPTRMANFLKI